MNTVGRRIAQQRESAGMSQDELGARVELNGSAIRRMESGERPVATHELFDIAEALSTTTAVLLGMEDVTAAGTLADSLSDRQTEGG